MRDFFNPNKKFTQQDIALLLGLKSDRQVRNLMNQGYLPKAKGREGMDPLACVHGYIRYKSSGIEEKQKAETGDEKSPEERQKARAEQLKNDEREERIKLNRIKRLVLEKQYGPITIITDTISQVAISLRTRVDSWLPKLKMVWPDMPPEAIELFKRELAAALNELSDVQPDLSDYEDSDIESGLASFESLEVDYADDGSGMGG